MQYRTLEMEILKSNFFHWSSLHFKTPLTVIHPSIHPSNCPIPICLMQGQRDQEPIPEATGTKHRITMPHPFSCIYAHKLIICCRTNSKYWPRLAKQLSQERKHNQFTEAMKPFKVTLYSNLLPCFVFGNVCFHTNRTLVTEVQSQTKNGQ